MILPISEAISTLETDKRRGTRRELVEACLNAAESSQSVFTRLYPQAALRAAEQADNDHAAGRAAAPLAGLPVSIKDLFDVAGEPTLAGSVVLHDAPPAQADALLVQRLRKAGAAIIGKTNMTEFAFSGLGLNPHYGTPANPADPHVARIPGGSSSGAAVSVAAGMCVAALASDTGGSIRIPAALCGLVGFKPTKRRVPADGALPLSSTLDSFGALTRSVADCILLDGILAGQALAVPQLPLQGLRLAVPLTLVLDGVDAHVARVFEAALSRLSEAGAQVIDIPLTLLAEAPSLGQFAGVEAYAWHRHLLATRLGEYDPRVGQRMLQGGAMSAADYLDLHAARARWIAAMAPELAPFDALLMPTSPVVAPLIAELQASDQAYFSANRLILRNNILINLLDGCAISLPIHPPGTLPVGLMVAGGALSDSHILGIAQAIENNNIALDSHGS